MTSKMKLKARCPVCFARDEFTSEIIWKHDCSGELEFVPDGNRIRCTSCGDQAHFSLWTFSHDGNDIVGSFSPSSPPDEPESEDSPSDEGDDSDKHEPEPDGLPPERGPSPSEEPVPVDGCSSFTLDAKYAINFIGQLTGVLGREWLMSALEELGDVG